MNFIKIAPKILYSKIYNDIYWSKEGGLEEKNYVFIEANQLKKRWAAKENFTIFELGFGAGLNFFATKIAWENSQTQGFLHYISTELHPIPKDTLREILIEFEELENHSLEFLEQYPENFFNIHRLEFKNSKIFLTLWIGNALDALKKLYFYADAFFLDGFSPPKNPEMWSKEIFSQMKFHSKEFSTFSTYSVAKVIKENAIENGFEIQTQKGFGTKKEMLLGKLKQSSSQNLVKKYFPMPIYNKALHKISIIGAGLSGLWLGYSFTLRNKKVTIIDEDITLSKNASSNPLGYFFPKLTKNPTLASELSLLGTTFTSYRISTLNKEFSETIGENTGVYLCFSNLKEKEDFESAIQSHNINPDLIEEKQVCILGEKKTVLHFKLGGYFKPFYFSQSMRNSLKSQGVEFLLGKKIQKLSYNGTWKLWDHKGLFLETEILILANSFGILDFEQSQLPFQKIRGQICFLPNEFKYQEKAPFILEDTYLISINEVQILGATFNPYDSNPFESPEHNELLLSRLRNSISNLPFYNGKNLSSKVGFRANSKDRLPVFGSLPIIEEYKKDYKNFQKGHNEKNYPFGKTYPNLYILAGMGSKGISYSSILAESLVALICGEAPPVPISILEGLHPARFIMRDIMHKKFK